MSSKKTSQFILDIVLPKEFKMDTRRGPNDVEANALYSLWKNSKPGQEAFEVPNEHKQHINGWKANGLVEGFSNGLKLTDKGRKMIIEMVTSEPNAFEKNARSPLYSEVKAKKTEATKARITRSSGASRPSYNRKRTRYANNGST